MWNKIKKAWIYVRASPYFDKIIDKLIIGVIAAVLIGYFQGRSNQFQKELDETRALNKTFATDIILKQRESLIEATGNYFSIIEAAKDFSTLKSKEADALITLTNRINFIVFLLSSIDERIKQDGNLFTESINEMDKLLVHPHEKAAIESQQEIVQKYFTKVLETIQNVARNKLQKELKAARP